MTARPRARRVVLAAAVLATAGALAAPASASGGETSPYIVVLDDNVRSASAVADEHRRSHGAQVNHTYEHALKGYAARLTRQGYADVVSDRRVAYVEADGVAYATTTQSNATWGLDRIDARSGLDKTYSYTQDGVGVTAYVIDTGIRMSHTEVAPRAVSGYDAVDGGTADDCNGHGTHVAGTIGGTTYGVAKGVTLVAVRVLDCGGSGTWSGVIAGMDWATGHHAAGSPAVANLSLGGGANSTVDAAVDRMIDDGIATAVAAGNGNTGGVAQDACKYSPARVARAMTIGATDNTDTKTSWSNYGKCVDWFAPGRGITSAWHTTDTATNTISGTSMATPHVAGAAALYLQADPGATALQVRDALYGQTTKDIVKSSKTANDHLLYTSPAGWSGTTSTATTDDGSTSEPTKPGNRK